MDELTAYMEIKDIGVTTERLASVEIASAFGFNISYVVWASVKKADWKNFHKLVVKIPAKREEMQQINKQLLVEAAVKKMQEVLKDAIIEPE